MIIMGIMKNRFMTGMSLMFHKILRLAEKGNSGLNTRTWEAKEGELLKA